ncbi:MAG: 2Fe-2S iron-sulfur cluster-binding protein [Bacteroidota bacterium]
MPVVSFIRLNKRKKIASGATLIAAANRSGIPIRQSCGGEGACGWCKVRIVEGADNLAEPSLSERKLMREKKFSADERAACRAKIFGDVGIVADYW